MLELSEMAKRILSELEEAHAEDISALMNTVLSGFGGQNELSELIGALEELA